MPVLLFCLLGCSGDASASERKVRAVENRARTSVAHAGRREERSLRLFDTNDIASGVERVFCFYARRFPSRPHSGIEDDAVSASTHPFVSADSPSSRARDGTPASHSPYSALRCQ